MFKYISIDEIDANDNRYSFSIPLHHDELIKSIEQMGLLEPVILLKSNNKFKIISGFNRISVIKKNNLKIEIKAVVYDELPIEEFKSLFFKKYYHDRISTIGKLKFYAFMHEFQPQSLKSILNILKIPVYFQNIDVVDNILKFPIIILEYFNKKNIGFKDIKNTLLLNCKNFEILNLWLSNITPKVNIFREVITLLVDLGKIKDLNKNIFDNDELLKSDIVFYDYLYNLRYPQYSEHKAKADVIVNSLKNKGVFVKYPQYFEGNEIEITLKLKKSDAGKEFLKTIKAIDEEVVEKILENL